MNLLESNAAAAGIGQIFYGATLATMFGNPGLPPSGDPRTPDIIVQPNVGVVYTGSTKKQAEHGGFAHDDTNVILLVSSILLQPRTITASVETAQIAPTILSYLVSIRMHSRLCRWKTLRFCRLISRRNQMLIPGRRSTSQPRPVFQLPEELLVLNRLPAEFLAECWRCGIR